jgi:hypothetical protein
MLANEYGIVELIDDYTRKNGIYDDHLTDQMRKTKTYKMNLEIMERKFSQIAANHLQLWLKYTDWS